MYIYSKILIIVDQPYTYFYCCINLGHYLISVLLFAVLGGNATILQWGCLCLPKCSLLQLPFIVCILINYYKTMHIAKGVATGTTSTTWALPLFYCPSQEIIIQMVTHFASLTSWIVFISHNVSLAVHYMHAVVQPRVGQSGPSPSQMTAVPCHLDCKKIEIL